MALRGRNSKNRHVEAIEEEFGEPLRDIIVGMREQGCNWRTIANALEIREITLIKWRRAMNMPIDQGTRIYEYNSRGKEFMPSADRTINDNRG